MEIEIQDVSMTYPNGKQALQNLNLHLKAPSLVGLLGQNGAGKSTLMKLLVAALLPTGGAIQVDHVPLSKAERALKSKLGYLPQDFGLFDTLTVTQFLDYMAALKGVPHPKDAIQQAIRAVNLEEKAKARIRTLSGGQRQRVGIAQALLGDPPFLIFDEPTVGLDPEERIHFRNLFSRAAEDRLVLLSTHIIEDVQSVCDRSSSCITGRSCSRAHRNSSFNLLSATWASFGKRTRCRRGGCTSLQGSTPARASAAGRWRMSSRPMPRWRSRHWRTPISI